MSDRIVDRLKGAGVETAQEGAGEVVTAAELASWAERDLRIWEMQPGNTLTEQDRAELAEHSGDGIVHALRRWAVVKHLFLRTNERTLALEAERALTARKLLTRQPVETELEDGTVVRVTGRSYAAMAQIARHWHRIRLLTVGLSHVAAAFSVTESTLETSTGRSTALRRRLTRLEDLHTRLYAELLAHRQMMYAHCFTPDGAPAKGPEDAPEWWNRVEDGSDARLLAALWYAGPGRFRELGAPPTPKNPGKPPAEDFGYASLLSSIERQNKAEPASYFDRDLFQLLTWARCAVPGLEDLEA